MNSTLLSLMSLLHALCDTATWCVWPLCTCIFWVVKLVCEQADGSISQHCTEILDKWLQLSDSSSAETTVVGFDSAIHNLIAKQTEQAVVKKPADSDDSERKRAILAQYGDVCDRDEYPWICAFLPVDQPCWWNRYYLVKQVLFGIRLHVGLFVCTKTDSYCSEIM